MVRRLNVFLILFFVFQCKYVGSAQETKPIILDVPKEWKYEKIDFPLDFAPEIPYKGFEELRFAPGMFDTSSSTYFTYVFVLAIEDKTKFSIKEIKKFLYKYYRGLSEAVATSKETKIDISEIKVRLKKKKKISGAQQYAAEIIFLDTFTNGQKVLLHMELEVISKKEENKSFLFAIVSPQLKDSEVWKELYDTRVKVRSHKILQ